MKIRAVIFDFGGVICFPPNDAQWREAASFCDTDPASLQAAFWKDRDGYDCGEDPRVYWKNIGEQLGLALDEAAIDGMIQREIAFWSRFDTRVLRWAGDLRMAGLGTGILSNLPRPIGENLRSLQGFLDHFDEVTFSYELGVLKPQVAIYQSAMRGLGIDPGEALFLDDRPANVDGARAVGLAAELFTSWEDFLANGSGRYGLPAPQM